VPNGDVVTAALSWTQTWISTGSAPPAAAKLYLDADGSLFRDTEGRVGGGIRRAAYDAPIASNVGVNAGPGFCILAGSHTDFTPVQLCERYSSPASYLSRVVAVTGKAEQDGFVLKTDADRTINEAKAVTFSCS
jgi:hypothetical protein